MSKIFSSDVAKNYKEIQRCPYCLAGWDEIETLPKESGWGDDGYVSQMVCLKCGEKWVEVYTFERIEECD